MSEITGGTRYCPDCGTPMDRYNPMRNVWACPRHPQHCVTDEGTFGAAHVLAIGRAES